MFGICAFRSQSSSQSSSQIHKYHKYQTHRTRKFAKIIQDSEDYQFVSPENHDYKEDFMLRAGAGVRVEQSPSLVLNADYTPLSHLPLSLWSWQDTLRAVFSGKATVVSTYQDLLVRSVSCTFPLPSVIALKTYQKMPNQTPVISRRNLYIRDGFKCQVRKKKRKLFILDTAVISHCNLIFVLHMNISV